LYNKPPQDLLAENAEGEKVRGGEGENVLNFLRHRILIPIPKIPNNY